MVAQYGALYSTRDTVGDIVANINPHCSRCRKRRTQGGEDGRPSPILVACSNFSSPLRMLWLILSLFLRCLHIFSLSLKKTLIFHEKDSMAKLWFRAKVFLLYHSSNNYVPSLVPLFLINI